MSHAADDDHDHHWPRARHAVTGSGSLRVRVGETVDETVLSGIMRLVREAQTSRTRAQRREAIATSVPALPRQFG